MKRNKHFIILSYRVIMLYIIGVFISFIINYMVSDNDFSSAKELGKLLKDGAITALPFIIYIIYVEYKKPKSNI